jgi:glycerate kinase
LDANLRHYSDILSGQLEKNIGEIPGTGAAGGLGAGLIAFANAELKPGIKIVLDAVRFDELIAGADLVITGEGKIDGQSLRGKVPLGVAERARKQNVPVVAVVGDIGNDAEQLYEKGISAIFSINRVAVPFKEAKLRCRSDLKAAVEDVMRLIKALRR